jgi:hypothetical protein
LSQVVAVVVKESQTTVVAVVLVDFSQAHSL